MQKFNLAAQIGGKTIFGKSGQVGTNDLYLIHKNMYPVPNYGSCMPALKFYHTSDNHAKHQILIIINGPTTIIHQFHAASWSSFLLSTPT